MCCMHSSPSEHALRYPPVELSPLNVCVATLPNFTQGYIGHGSEPRSCGNGGGLADLTLYLLAPQLYK